MGLHAELLQRIDQPESEFVSTSLSADFTGYYSLINVKVYRNWTQCGITFRKKEIWQDLRLQNCGKW